MRKYLILFIVLLLLLYATPLQAIDYQLGGGRLILKPDGAYFLNDIRVPVNAYILGLCNLGADDDIAYLYIHDAGTITMYDDSDDTSVAIGPVANGTTVLGITGSIDASGNIEGTTYASDSSVSDAELKYIGTLSSNAQDQLDARCLESVFGTAIGTGLTLDGTTLKTHAALQSIAGLTETNGGIPYGTADNAYSWLAAGAEGTLLMGNGAAAPSWLGAGTAGYFLLANGAADPVWTTQPTLASLESLTIAAGTLVYGTGADALAALAAGATTQILVGGGAAAPVWTTATGTGAPVRAESPTLTTQITIPKVLGGVGTTSDLYLQTTSGVGAAGADMHFLVGNNGATEAVTILNSGNVGIGTTSPDDKSHVEIDSATTNDKVSIARYSVTSTGTPAAGLGPRLNFEVETAAGAPGNQEVIATICAVATDVTPTNEDGAFCFSTMKSGATATEDVRIENLRLGVNDTSPDATINAVSGSASTVTCLLEGAASQSADILRVVNSGQSLKFTVDVDGDTWMHDANVVGNLYSGAMTYATDSGAVTAIDMGVSSDPNDGTEESLAFAVDGVVQAKFYTESNGAGTVDTPHVVMPGAFNFGADAGANDDYAITLKQTPSAYVTGMLLMFSANTANTGACTLNVNSLGAKALKSLHDQDPQDNYIEAGSVIMVVYDGTNFQILSPDANP